MGLVLCVRVEWVSMWAAVRLYRAYVDGLCLHVIGCVVRYRVYVVERIMSLLLSGNSSLPDADKNITCIVFLFLLSSPRRQLL